MKFIEDATVITEFADLVILEGTECCIFRHLHCDLRHIKAKYRDYIPEEVIALYLMSFDNIEELPMALRLVDINFFLDVITQEKNFLVKNNEEKLLCNHTVEEHLHALESSKEKLEKNKNEYFNQRRWLQ